MNEKQNAVFTIGIIAAIILIFTVADLVKSDGELSDTQQRMMTVSPEFSWEGLSYGDYTADYEEYLSDSFVSRRKWCGMKTWTDRLLQKKEINGVYLCEDDCLIEQHKPTDELKELEDIRLAALTELVEKQDAKVMLVPCADIVWTQKLPDYAVYYDQEAYLERVKEAVGEKNYVDVYAALKEHAQEAIYYRTDSHWTSLGAYYGYLAWSETVGRLSYPYSPERMVKVSDDFLGNLHSRVNLDMEGEEIRVFSRTRRGSVEADAALTEITTDFQNARTIFIIKDSYADNFIPLLTNQYQKIYVLDLQYFEGDLLAFMEGCKPEGGMDVLVLYNCITFLEEFEWK